MHFTLTQLDMLANFTLWLWPIIVVVLSHVIIAAGRWWIASKQIKIRFLPQADIDEVSGSYESKSKYVVEVTNTSNVRQDVSLIDIDNGKSEIVIGLYSKSEIFMTSSLATSRIRLAGSEVEVKDFNKNRLIIGEYESLRIEVSTPRHSLLQFSETNRRRVNVRSNGKTYRLKLNSSEVKSMIECAEIARKRDGMKIGDLSEDARERASEEFSKEVKNRLEQDLTQKNASVIAEWLHKHEKMCFNANLRHATAKDYESCSCSQSPMIRTDNQESFLLHASMLEQEREEEVGSWWDRPSQTLEMQSVVAHDEAPSRVSEWVAIAKARQQSVGRSWQSKSSHNDLFLESRSLAKHHLARCPLCKVMINEWPVYYREFLECNYVNDQ